VKVSQYPLLITNYTLASQLLASRVVLSKLGEMNCKLFTRLNRLSIPSTFYVHTQQANDVEVAVLLL